MAANHSKSHSLSLLQNLFAVTAFVLMWFGSIGCKFLKFTQTGVSNPVDLQLGIWKYQYWNYIFTTSGNIIVESCHGYPDSVTIDGNWKAAQAFCIISLILGIIGLVISGIATFATHRPDSVLTHVWEAPLYLLIAICQGLTLLFLNSNACKGEILNELAGVAMTDYNFPDTCSMASGAKLAISATSFWGATAVASFLAHKSEKEEIAEEVGAGLRAPLVP